MTSEKAGKGRVEKAGRLGVALTPRDIDGFQCPAAYFADRALQVRAAMLVSIDWVDGRSPCYIFLLPCPVVTDGTARGRDLGTQCVTARIARAHSIVTVDSVLRTDG